MYPKYFYLLFVLFFLFACTTSKKNIEPLQSSLKHQCDTVFTNGVKVIKLYDDSLIYNYLSGIGIEYNVIYSIPVEKVNNIFFKN